jgi:hypothetical protein
MTEYLTDLNYTIRINFWRSAAYLTGMAVRHKRIIHRVLYLAPVGLAAILAYVFGRLFGEILLWGLSF